MRLRLRRPRIEPTTIDAYRADLTMLERFLERGVTTATTADIEAWIASCPAKPRTIGRRLSTLAGFFRWAVPRGVVATDPTALVARPKVGSNPPRPMPEDELVEVWRRANPKMRCWLALAAYAGLRCCEIARLRAEDVDLDTAELKVRGKGSKSRVVPAHPLVLDALRSFGMPSEGPVFVNQLGRPVSARGVSVTGNAFLRRCGVDRTMHTVRHRFGTETYKATRDIRVVAELMGHSSLSTTMIYTQVPSEAGAAAVAALPVAV
jgi:integrase/recombinase XerC